MIKFKSDFHTNLISLYQFTRPKKVEKKQEKTEINDDEIIETDDGLKWQKDKDGNLIQI